MVHMLDNNANVFQLVLTKMFLFEIGYCTVYLFGNCIVCYKEDIVTDRNHMALQQGPTAFAHTMSPQIGWASNGTYLLTYPHSCPPTNTLAYPLAYLPLHVG